MRNFLIVIFSFAAVFVGIGTLIHFATIGKIEHTLEKKAVDLLVDAMPTEVDSSGLKVSFAGSGLNGKVIGNAPDEETLMFVEKAVASVNDSTDFSIGSLASELRLDARFMVFTIDRTPYVRGRTSPSMGLELQAAIIVALKREAQDASRASGSGEGTQFAEFVRQENVEDPAWFLPACEFLKVFLPTTRTRDPKFSINNRNILIAGLVDDEKTRQSTIAKAHEIFPEYGADRIDVSGLEVDRPAIPSHIAIRTDTMGSVTIIGQVQTVAIADHIIDAIESSLHPYQTITNAAVQHSDKAEPAIWLEDFAAYIQSLFDNIASPQLHVQGYRVVVGGSAPNQATLNEIASKTVAQFDNLTLVNQFKLATSSNESNLQLLQQLETTDILFDVNQATIRSSEAPKLEALADTLKKMPGTCVVISGYADPTGNASLNKRLSRQRCQSVRTYFIQSGIDASTLEIVENGADTSLDTKNSNLLQNGRRVEFALKPLAESDTSGRTRGLIE